MQSDPTSQGGSGCLPGSTKPALGTRSTSLPLERGRVAGGGSRTRGNSAPSRWDGGDEAASGAQDSLISGGREALLVDAVDPPDQTFMNEQPAAEAMFTPVQVALPPTSRLDEVPSVRNPSDQAPAGTSSNSQNEGAQSSFSIEALQWITAWGSNCESPSSVAGPTVDLEASRNGDPQVPEPSPATSDAADIAQLTLRNLRQNQELLKGFNFQGLFDAAISSLSEGAVDRNLTAVGHEEDSRRAAPSSRTYTGPRSFADLEDTWSGSDFEGPVRRMGRASSPRTIDRGVQTTPVQIQGQRRKPTRSSAVDERPSKGVIIYKPVGLNLNIKFI